MKAINIEWDIDDEDCDEDLNLPTEIDIPENMTDDEIPDYLTDITGFCHKGYILVGEN